MSLVQHLSAIDGIDREAEDESDEFPSIRRKLSYDVSQSPNESIPIAERRPGIPPYEQSPKMRIGTSHLPPSQVSSKNPSPSHRNRPDMLERIGDRLRLRSSKTHPRCRRRLSRAMHTRRGDRASEAVLPAGSQVRCTLGFITICELILLD